MIWLTDPIELNFWRNLILTHAIIHSWLISLQLVFDNILEVRIFFAPFGSYITARLEFYLIILLQICHKSQNYLGLIILTFRHASINQFQGSVLQEVACHLLNGKSV